MLRSLPLFVLLASSAYSQHIGFGVKGGITPADDVQGFATSESKHYIVGPMVEMTLPFRFGVEVDALYSRLGYRTSNGNFAGSFTSDVRGNSWEFPLLLKYRVPFPLVHPYLTGGYSPRRISGTVDTQGVSIDIPTGRQTPYSNQSSWKPDVSHGLVIGGGVEFGAGHLRIAPEVRYTHWSNDIIQAQGTQGYFVNASQNQARILVGISWR